jgi:hypothetical protein
MIFKPDSLKTIFSRKEECGLTNRLLLLSDKVREIPEAMRANKKAGGALKIRKIMVKLLVAVYKITKRQKGLMFLGPEAQLMYETKRDDQANKSVTIVEDLEVRNESKNVLSIFFQKRLDI